MNLRKFLSTALCGLVAAGCSFHSSPETFYYVLSTSSSFAADPPGELNSVNGPRIAVGPVTVPGYLDHERVFVRENGRSRVRLEEYHHWGEPLDEGIGRVLCDVLSARPTIKNSVVFPLRAAMSPDWRVSVDVARFDGAPGETVVLDAGWTIASSAGTPVLQGRFSKSLAAGSSVSAMVEAQSRLLEMLGQELACALSTLPQHTRPLLHR